MFRFRKGAHVSYNRQGYIYFVSRIYRDLPPALQRKILNLCIEHGGPHYGALFEYVTTDTTGVAICRKHYISQKTLDRAVRRYYEGFPVPLLEE